MGEQRKSSLMKKDNEGSKEKVRSKESLKKESKEEVRSRQSDSESETDPKNKKPKAKAKTKTKNVDKKTKKKKKPRCKACGLCLRIFHFILNALIWVIANVAIIGGFVVGFSTDTILFPFECLDFWATTPIILFVEYGLCLALVTSIGCFVGAGAHCLVIIIYIILALGLLAVDFLFGVRLYIFPNALPKFMTSIQDSMKGYDVDGAPSVGIFRLKPKTYWDHVQLRGKCCGTNVWTEWLDTPVATKDFSFPYSCCNDEYRYAECGEKMLGPYSHPNSENHNISDMVFLMGCVTKLPTSLQESFNQTAIIGVFVGAVIVLAVLVAIVLLILVCSKCYDPNAWTPPVEQARTKPKKKKAAKKEGKAKNKVAPGEEGDTAPKKSDDDEEPDVTNHQNRNAQEIERDWAHAMDLSVYSDENIIGRSADGGGKRRKHSFDEGEGEKVTRFEEDEGNKPRHSLTDDSGEDNKPRRESLKEKQDEGNKPRRNSLQENEDKDDKPRRNSVNDYPVKVDEHRRHSHSKDSDDDKKHRRHSHEEDSDKHDKHRRHSHRKDSDDDRKHRRHSHSKEDEKHRRHSHQEDSDKHKHDKHRRHSHRKDSDEHDKHRRHSREEDRHKHHKRRRSGKKH